MRQAARLGSAIDWTLFDAVLPSGRRVRYQVRRVAVPRRGRALPLLQLAYDNRRLPAGTSQNRFEEVARAAVVRAAFLAWLQQHGLDDVGRIDKGTCLTEAGGRRWELGHDGRRPGELRWAPGARDGLYHDRPRDLVLHVASCWRVPKGHARDPRRKPPAAPRYLATSLGDPAQAAAWYGQRGRIEQRFRDRKQRFGPAAVQVGRPERLSRLLAALTLALAWLTLAALPEAGALPRGWAAAVAQRGRPDLIGLALALIDRPHDLPPGGLSAVPRAAGMRQGAMTP